MIINKKNIILILILSILMIIACSYIPVNAILTADKLSGTSTSQCFKNSWNNWLSYVYYYNDITWS